MGNRMVNLQLAMESLAEIGTVINSSSVYETDPWGFKDQPAFYNQVILLATSLEPADLLQAVKKIEQRIGRTPSFRYGPRVIDIDILLFDNIVITTPSLTIPHPMMKERPFVLVPLAEIAPQLIFPDDQANISQVLEDAGQNGIRKVEC